MPDAIEQPISKGKWVADLASRRTARYTAIDLGDGGRGIITVYVYRLEGISKEDASRYLAAIVTGQFSVDPNAHSRTTGEAIRLELAKYPIATRKCLGNVSRRDNVLTISYDIGILESYTVRFRIEGQNLVLVELNYAAA